MMETTPAPAGLSKDAARWWARLMDAMDWEPHELMVLESGLQAWDRWQEARSVVDRDGLLAAGRFGQQRANPAIAIEIASRSAFLTAFKQLRIDPEPGDKLTVSEAARRAALARWQPRRPS